MFKCLFENETHDHRLDTQPKTSEEVCAYVAQVILVMAFVMEVQPREELVVGPCDIHSTLTRPSHHAYTFDPT